MIDMEEIHLLPDDVLLIGQVGNMTNARNLIAQFSSAQPRRKVICFEGDIDVKLLREAEAESGA